MQPTPLATVLPRPTVTRRAPPFLTLVPGCVIEGRVREEASAMIIDTHAHITGPMEMYEYFRGLAGTSGAGTRMGKFDYSDEQLEESLQAHLTEVGEVGTELQLVSPRPWAVPTGDRREALVMTVTQQVNDMIARAVKLHPDRFVGLGALPQRGAVSPANCVAEMERCVNEL